MRRIGSTFLAVGILLMGGVALGVPRNAPDPLADLERDVDAPVSRKPLVATPTSPFEVELALKKYDEAEALISGELVKIDSELAIVDERVFARGRAYFKQVRAGLLPAGGGFDELVDHAASVERNRAALGRDLNKQSALRKKRVKFADELTALKSERAPLDVHRDAISKAKSVMRQADERRASFDRAFSGSTAPSDYVAIYGADTGPRDAADNIGFSGLFGRLPLPIAGRAEITKLGASEANGPGLELRATPGAMARAVAAGRVVFADRYDDDKLTVILDHGGRFFTVYGNLERSEVKVGENVKPSATLGLVAERGREGAILYFELRKEGRPVEPAPWFGL